MNGTESGRGAPGRPLLTRGEWESASKRESLRKQRENRKFSERVKAKLKARRGF